MDALDAKLPLTRRVLALASVAILATTACAPQAPAPTAAPAKPPPAAPAPPAPTAAPAKPAATAAPAKPAATAAPAKPAATAAPAAKPTEKPAAKAAEFDEKAVADFYKGKTVRIIVGFGAGGATDVNARLLQKALPKYLPGNPTMVVENRPGGGGLLAANTVYATEAKDGTVFVAEDGQIALQQAMGAPGVQFDAAKFQWLGTTFESPAACSARTDSGITKIEDIIGGGKELTLSSYGKGTNSYDPPAIFNATVGTRFKIVTGYESSAAQMLAVQNKEVQGFCLSLETTLRANRNILEGSNPVARVLLVSGQEVPKREFLNNAQAAGKLAKTDEAKTMLNAVLDAPGKALLAFAAAPEVPKDRIQALRRAFDKAYADPEYRDGAEKANIAVSPRSGEEVTQLIQQMLTMPPAVLAKVKEVLQ